MRDDTKYLLDTLPQLEATFSYACLALANGMLPPEQQEQFGKALIAMGNRVVEHSTQPIEMTECNTYLCSHPRCWVDTPFALHESVIAKIDPEMTRDWPEMTDNPEEFPKK